MKNQTDTRFDEICLHGFITRECKRGCMTRAIESILEEKRRTVCGCREYYQSFGMNKMIKTIKDGVCQFCGTKQE